MIKKCCFIIPYFGHFPNYFQLFLNSCKYNPDFNWLIITDNDDKYDYPPNVRMEKMSFHEMKDYIQSFFGFKIVLHSPHKLCDYKPAYGYLFEGWIEGYEYWGYCDMDVIMGNLNKFLTDEFMSGYDKIFCLGHMTIFRNTKENNRLFLHDYKGRSLFRHSFSTTATTTFDEEWRDEYNINRIFINEGKRVFAGDWAMNLSIFHNQFVRTEYVGMEKYPQNHGYVEESYKKALYVWDKGHIYRYYLQNADLQKEEYIYMHLQARRMKVSETVVHADTFKIVPDEFLPLEVEEVTKCNFPRIKKSGRCQHVQRIWKKKVKNKLSKIFMQLCRKSQL